MSRNTGDGALSTSTLSFSSFVEGEDVLAEEFEETRYVRPVEETQPPLQEPSHQRHGQEQQNAMHNIMTVNQVNDASLTRIMARLRSLEEQLREIEAQLRSCLQHWLALNSSSPSRLIDMTTTPQQETILGASGPYTMAGSRHIFYEARQYQQIGRALRQNLADLEDHMSWPLHKQTEPSTRTQRQACFIQGIQQDPMLVERSDIRTMPLSTASEIGVVWNLHLSNHQHIWREERVTLTVYSQLMVCPRCNCQIQLGAQIRVKRTRAGVMVIPKRIYIIRALFTRQLLIHTQPQQQDICEPVTYYILVKVHIGETVSRETYWEITV